MKHDTKSVEKGCDIKCCVCKKTYCNSCKFSHDISTHTSAVLNIFGTGFEVLTLVRIRN